MAQRTVSRGTTPFLIFLFFAGFSLNLLAWLDVQYFHYVLRLEQRDLTNLPQGEIIEILKKSILNVRVQRCGSITEWGSGTGFVVKSGYIATAAHVVEEHQKCGNAIRVVDYRGVDYAAQLAGFSSESDLAILSFGNTSLPALKLADSTQYEGVTDLDKVVTIGYPLVGTASSADKAAVSGEGNISRFDSAKNVFITSGMNLNPGNSGGPILVMKSWTVLGIAVQKIDVTVGEGLGVTVPSKTFVKFFRDKTGQDLLG